jgi:cell wall-associated NlpC family hydrolase
MADTTGIPSGQKMSTNIDKNISKQKAFNKELDITLQKANAILKAFGMPQMGAGGGNGGAGSVTTSGTFSGVMGTIGRIGATVAGVAAGAAQALPGVQEVLGTQLLTAQARFSGVGNPAALAQASMRGGQATSATDSLEAMRSGAQGGLLGNLPGYGGIMNGVSQLSNLTGSQSSAMKAAVGLNSAQSVNTMRMFGINVRGANGAARPANEVFKDIYNFASGQIGHKLTPEELAISLQPGNGFANFLDAAAAGNSELRNALQMAAQQFAKGGDLSRSSTNKTGATTAAQGAQSDLFAGKLGLQDAAAPAMSKGFMEAAVQINKFNKRMETTLETSKLANDAVKQLAKAETLAADQIGQAAISIMSVLATSGLGGMLLGRTGAALGKSGGGVGIGKVGVLGIGASLAGDAVSRGAEHGSARSRTGSALQYGAIGATIGSIIPGLGTATGALVGGLIGAIGGLGLGASVSSPNASGANLAAGNAVVGVALSKIGTPYSWGGGSTSGPTVGMGSGRDTVGFDCSSFTRFVMAKVGVVIPRTAHEQQQIGTQVDPMTAQPGDLLFWNRPATHVAIYMGNGMMIEAPRTGDVVKRIGVNLKTVTSCSRVLNHKTGTTGISNIMNAAGGYKGTGNYGIESMASQVTVSELRGNTANEAMSGGTSPTSGLGFGDSSSPYGSSNTFEMTKQYLTINQQDGKLETRNNASGTTINYGGVTVKVDVPHGAQVTAQDLSKAIKAELKSLPISSKVATT